MSGPITATLDRAQRIAAVRYKFRRILNRIEPHLGCVACGARIKDGRCERCDP